MRYVSRKAMPTSSKKNLTLDQKIIIIDEYEMRSASFPTPKEMALWTKTIFGLLDTPNISTISRILRAKDELRKQKDDGAESGKKRSRSVKYPELDEALMIWVSDLEHRKVSISYDLIREKGCQLRDGLNARLSIDKQLSIEFSNGWLQSFCTRHHFKVHRQHGESGSVNTELVEQELPPLKALLSGYASRDIFNADETGLFYRMSPDKSISARQIEGIKKDKTRITILFCANADGSEKFPPLFIGKSQRPRSFGKKKADEYGLEYQFNNKAWMTKDIFFWFSSFDNKIGRTPGRTVLLLFDNFSGHGKIGYLPALENTTVHFLPPNCTSKLQPMDAGIIASFKTRYRKQQLRHAVILSDRGSLKPYELDQLTAMKWTDKIWNEIPNTVHQNCWQHTKILHQSIAPAAYDDTSAIRAEVEALLQVAVSVPENRISVNSLVEFPDEANMESVSMEELVDSVVRQSDSVALEQKNESGEDLERPCPSLKHVNAALALTYDYAHHPSQIRKSLDIDLKAINTLLESYK